MDIATIRLHGDDLLPVAPRRCATTFAVVESARWRHLFDNALDLVHYAGSCQRVGRCMRLAIIYDRQWVGGIVLGSTFPNIDDRDRFLGLKRYISGWQARGLRSPWAAENTAYWSRLQGVVNHARTFVFPEFQGRGLAVSAHRELLRSGVHLWEHKYGSRVWALDTLCDDGDSKLFLANKWTLVGETKGYHADYRRTFARRDPDRRGLRNNVGLTLGRRRWVVWVVRLDVSRRLRRASTSR